MSRLPCRYNLDLAREVVYPPRSDAAKVRFRSLPRVGLPYVGRYFKARCHRTNIGNRKFLLLPSLSLSILGAIPSAWIFKSPLRLFDNLDQINGEVVSSHERASRWWRTLDTCQIHRSARHVYVEVNVSLVITVYVSARTKSSEIISPGHRR